MVVDYDFRLARIHLRGNGWRGLAALAMVLVARAAIIGAIAVAARPGCLRLVQVLERLV